MSAREQQAASTPTAAAQEQTSGLLDQIVDLMPRAVERDRAKDMIDNLVGQVMAGTVVWDKSVTKTINKAIDAIDAVLSKQLAAIMHAPAFQALEGSWRG